MTSTPRPVTAATVAAVLVALTVTTSTAACGLPAPADPATTATAIPTYPVPSVLPSPTPSYPTPSYPTPSYPSPTYPSPTPSAAPAAVPPTPAPPPPGPRPANGKQFVRTGPKGQGQLVIENGTGDDGYVTLAVTTTARVAVYVRANATTRVRGIPDGTYVLFFSTGTGWNNPLRAFTGSSRTERFDDSFVFTTKSSSYTEWSVTLNTVPDGNASSSPVDPASVPR